MMGGEAVSMWDRDRWRSPGDRELERRNRLVRRVLLGIVALLLLASFAIGIRW